MIQNMWNISVDNYEKVTTLPEKIIEQQCEYLKKLTEGRVIGNIKRYNGKTTDYEEKSTALRMQELYGTRNIDIQENLGDLGNIPNIYFTFEFYLSSPNTPKYKFRIMFLSYVSDQYPLELVLDEDIADEIYENEKVLCANEEEFIRYMTQIINSSKVSSVIRALNNIAM